MCNRYQLNASSSQLIRQFTLPADSVLNDYLAEYFPGKPAPVIIQAPESRQIRAMTWGFAPFQGKRPINNTRSESAANSGFWKRHLGRRCVFPLSHVIEWQHQVDTRTGELRKLPHTIHFRDNRIAAVAGIYHPGQAPDAGCESDGGCCSMMTCRANRFWSNIHNKNPDDPRMICFLLGDEEVAAWLDEDRPYEAVRHLLRPAPDDGELLEAEPGIREVDGGGLFG